jgi:mannitol 2-dehydrogenase
MQASVQKMSRLSNHVLESSALAHVQKPVYNRAAVHEGIVHIGVGGFHRSHQALYIDDLLAYPDTTMWGICGVGIREADGAMADALNPQNSLYTLIEREGTETSYRVIGSQKRFLWAYTDMPKILEALSSPHTHLITLTVTEGGYCCDDASGALKWDHPDIVHDMSRPSIPKTLYGYLWYAFELRQKQGLPVTVLSCDNIQQNGVLLRGAVLDFLSKVAPELIPYVKSQVAFPSSMVDRITPMTSQQDRIDAEQHLGVRDAWPVSCESFKQWVIEDDFASQKPPLDRVGVQFTHDVEPYERMKLRLLNAGHSALGYLGYLCGYRQIHEVAADPLFQGLLKKMWHEEVIGLLPSVEGVDFAQYTEMLLKRFQNASIADQVSRICMDGSSKLPKFILPSVREQLQRNGSYEALALVVAGWCQYLQGKDESGETIEIQDPLRHTLQQWASRTNVQQSTFDWDGLKPVLGPLLDQEIFLNRVQYWWKNLSLHGTRSCITQLLSTNC